MLQRETGLEEVAETGVMIHGDVSADLLRTIFTPKSPLHDGAVIIRDERIVAAGALLPLAETSIHTERFGTRHRAALGITEQTDAVVVVVSEENGQISLVERARIVRNLTEAGLVARDPGAARSGRRPARRLRLAIRRPVGRTSADDRRGCASSAASWARSGAPRDAHRRPPRAATAASVAAADRRRRPNPRPPPTRHRRPAADDRGGALGRHAGAAPPVAPGSTAPSAGGR